MSVVTKAQDSLSIEELPSIDELNRQLENPLSRFWSLIFQENYTWNEGDLLPQTYTSNVLNFQPSLPIPVGKRKMLLVRPVFPLVSLPKIDENGNQVGFEHGVGDMNVFSLYGPDKKDGLIWGAGLTFVFPIAQKEDFGSGKYQMGPSVMLLSITKEMTMGAILQHWESYAGDPNRPETSSSELQYIIRKQIQGKGMSIGMGPSIKVDWKQEKENRWSVPIGLGITKTVKWGNTPFKLRFEPQYAIIKPRDFGTQWNIRIQIAPIIKNPFLK